MAFQALAEAPSLFRGWNFGTPNNPVQLLYGLFHRISDRP